MSLRDAVETFGGEAMAGRGGQPMAAGLIAGVALGFALGCAYTFWLLAPVIPLAIS